MYHDRPKEQLLYEDVEINIENATGSHSSSRQRGQHSSHYVRVVSVILIFGLFVWNIVLQRNINTLQNRPSVCRSRFSGIGYDTPLEYKSRTEWGDANESLAEKAWDTIDSSPIVVALSDDYASQYGLDKSIRFPWDDTKGIYHIKAFHHLHCLKSMRKAFLDAHFGRKSVIPYEHFFHCVDSLRQDVTCLADDTPMPTVNKLHYIGDGQIRQCRDLNKLKAWTQEPERQSCYHMMGDYRPVRHTLEEFDNCPPNSQYHSIAKAYFDKYGHKDPYGN